MRSVRTLSILFLMTLTSTAQVFSLYDGLIIKTNGSACIINCPSLTNGLTLADVANFIQTNLFNKVYIKSNNALAGLITTNIPALNQTFTNTYGCRIAVWARVTCTAVLASSATAEIVVDGRQEMATSCGTVVNVAPGGLFAIVNTNQTYSINSTTTGLGSVSIDTFTVKAL